MSTGGEEGIANDIEVKLFWQRTEPEIARDAIHELENHISIPGDRIKVTVEGRLGNDGRHC